MSRLVRVEFVDRIEALERLGISIDNALGNLLLKFIRGEGITKREERILVESKLLEYVDFDGQGIERGGVKWKLVGYPQVTTISRFGVEYLEMVYEEEPEYKKRQKELLTEIMNEDQKDGLYDTEQSPVKWLRDLYVTRKTPILYAEDFKKAIEMEEQVAFKHFQAGQNSMEEKGKSFDQYYQKECTHQYIDEKGIASRFCLKCEMPHRL